MSLLLTVAAMAAPPEFDLVVYGGTSAAVTAAVQAADDGLRVVVVSPDTHLGGLSSGGLGWTDSGRKEAIGGLSRDFYRRVGAKYAKPDAWRQQTADEYLSLPRFEKRRPVTDDGAYWNFEPHVAEAVFEELIAERGIRVDLGQRLDREDGVRKDGRRIVSIRTLHGTEYRGRIFIDATYEGDLMAAAGISYTVGRESNDAYGETLNGVQSGVRHSHHFGGETAAISPFVDPDDPGSGLLPLITNAEPVRPDGSGDDRVQAYCFRMCLTDDAENRVAFPKPDGYDPARYELLGRVLDAGWRDVWKKFDPIPNRKTDTNNHGPVSTDFLGGSHDYPEASYAERAAIVDEHRRYQQGLMWFLANDPRVPADVREQMSRWGMAADEFIDNGHWPHQIYVREARRMIGSRVISERTLRGLDETNTPIAMGSYNIDSHNVQRYVTADGHVQNEGDVQVPPGGPYRIGYFAIVPRRAECENLLVPVCVSASHIAYGSIRMEPVFMALGQSAAVAAEIAVRGDLAVQDVPYPDLARRLQKLGQVLDLPTATAYRPSKPPRRLGPLADDEPELSGEWTRSSSVRPYVGREYWATTGPTDGAAFTVTVADAGWYRVIVHYPPHENRVSQAALLVNGAAWGAIDQRRAPPEFVGGRVRVGKGETVRIVLARVLGSDGYLIADAVELQPVTE